MQISRSTTLKKVDELTKKFKNKEEIKDFVYEKYPEYTVNSILLPHEKTKTSGAYTIGYEGKSIDFFINQLVQNKISTLVDVRKNAMSMKRGFSKSTLKNQLEKAGIKYGHHPELGIDSDKRKSLETKEDYDALFREYKKTLPEKRTEVEELKEMSKHERIAIMCFEKDPEYCHRGQISEYAGGFTHL